MIIQSPSHSSKAVYQAMETFVKEVPSTIDAAAFERHRMALVAEITEPHKNLWERAEFFWSSMGQGDYSFESRDKLAAAVEAITYENWLEFFRAEFIDSPRSLLVIAPGQFADRCLHGVCGFRCAGTYSVSHEARRSATAAADAIQGDLVHVVQQF